MTRSPLAWALSLPVWFYRKVVSPMKPPTCRFDPTCSSYALEALEVHGALRGSWLAARRLCRCHPFCEPGHDPVPPRRPRGDAAVDEGAVDHRWRASPEVDRGASATSSPSASHRAARVRGPRRR